MAARVTVRLKAKRCRMCGEMKPLDAFNACSATSDGKYSYCRPCGSRRASEWKKANKPKQSPTPETRAKWAAIAAQAAAEERV